MPGRRGCPGVNRRQLLQLVGGTLPVALAGCTGQPPDDGTDPTDTSSPSPFPSPSPTTSSEGRRIEVGSRADQPDAPVAYEVGMVESIATDEHPARLRVTIANKSDSAVTIGEERDVQFHHVSSAGHELYLHPAGDGGDDGPVEAGCWRLTDYVAVPEYYGTIEIPAGDEVSGESFVYGHPELPDDVCLPDGEHQLTTTGRAAEGEEFHDDSTDHVEFEWGFSLQVA